MEYIPPSIPILCNSKYTMFHFGVDSHSFTKEPQHDLYSLASPNGEMKSSFSWTSLFKSPTSGTLCSGEPTLGKLNQVKLLCSPTSSTLCHPTLAKLNHEPTLEKLYQKLHLQRSIKSSCCVKLSLTSQSLHLFGTPNSILVQHTKFLSSTAT